MPLGGESVCEWINDFYRFDIYLIHLIIFSAICCDYGESAFRCKEFNSDTMIVCNKVILFNEHSLTK